MGGNSIFIKIPCISLPGFYVFLRRLLLSSLRRIYPSSRTVLRGDKMEMTSELTHNMFKASSLFPLVSTGRGDVLAPGNLFTEKDIWKEKDEALELKCKNLHTKHVTSIEEVRDALSLQEVVGIHGSPSSLAACMTEIKDSLKDAHERCKVASESTEEKSHQVEEY